MSAAIVSIVPKVELKRILFTTDFTEASRRPSPIVSAIARRYGAKVFVAHVQTPNVSPMVASEAVAVLDRQTEREARLELEKLQQTYAFDGIRVEPLLSCGNPAGEIARLADRHEISLLVMSTHGMSGLKHRVLGSVAEDVVRMVRCPVLTVGPRLAERFMKSEDIRNILFPTDFSLESMAVFPYLASLADEYKSRLTTLHVVPRDPSGCPETKQAIDILCERMKQALINEISPRSSAQFVVDYGTPAETILSHAHRINADLIGLGVRGCTDIARHFRETVAYQILAEAECPVLTRHTAR